MARLRLGRYEVEEYPLPLRCAKCGGKPAEPQRRRFSWHPSGLALLILLGVIGIILYVVFSSALTKRMTVPLPLCETHRNYWRNRSILLYGGLLAVLVLGSLAFVVAGVVYSMEGESGAFLIAALGTGALFFVWLFPAAFILTGGIQATEITERSITLVGLSAELVEEVRRDRRGYDEEDEDDHSRHTRRREEKGERRRGDADREDEGGYYDPAKELRRRNRNDEDES
jgi:hypothetical protein